MKRSLFATFLLLAILLPSRQAAGQTAPGNLGDQLIQAVRNFDTTAVQQLLQNGANIEAKNQSGNTALILGAANCNSDIVNLLLQHGAQTEAKGRYGETALSEAATCHKADVVKLLLDKGASIEAKDDQGESSLFYAVQNGHVEIVGLLLERGANIEAKGKDNHTALMKASGYSSSKADVVELLLDKGANIEARDNFGSTALSEAAYWDKPDVVKLLLEKRANIEARSNIGATALIMATFGGRIPVVKVLLDKGANIETKDNKGSTPLMYAAQSGNTEMAALLLERGADITVKNNDGQTAAMVAEQNKKQELAAMLSKVSDMPGSVDVNALARSTVLSERMNPYLSDLQKGTNINDLLGRAVREGHSDVVAALIDKGANIEGKNKDGNTALLVATQEGKTDVVKLLLERGANLEAKDKDGKTALIESAQEGKTDVVKLLLEKGVNLEAKDKDGCTALIESATEGKTDAMKLLLEKGANIEAQDNGGDTALLVAAYNGKIEIVKLLLEKGAYLEAKESANYPFRGGTALLVAASEGKADIVKLLLEKGANLEAKDKDGLTALLIAAAGLRPRPQIVKLLLEYGADTEAKTSRGNTALAWLTSQRGSQISYLNRSHTDTGFNKDEEEELAKTNETISLLEDAISKTPERRFASYVNLLQSRPYDDAQREKTVQAAAALSAFPPIPDEAKQLFLQATALLQNIRINQASTADDLGKPIDLLRKAVNIAPWWGNAYYNLSRAWELDGQYDEAVKQMNYYLELKPSEADAAAARSHIAVIQEEKEAAARKEQENESKLTVKYVSGGVTRLRKDDAPKWWHNSGSIDTLYNYFVPEEWPFYINTFRFPNGHFLAISLIAQSNNGAYAGDRIGVYDITDHSCTEGNDFAFGAQDYTTSCGGRYYVKVSDQPNATVTITYPATGASVTLPVALLYRGRALQGRGIFGFGTCSYGMVHQGGARAMVLHFDCSVVKAAVDPTVNAAGLTPTTVKPE